MIVSKTNRLSVNAWTTTGEPSSILFAHVALQGGELDNWGTMGCCLVVDGQVYGVTNYHVLFGEHTPPYVQEYLAGKLPVYQLTRNQEQELNQRIGCASNLFNPTLDYALVEVAPTFDLASFPRLGEPIEPCIGMYVYKIGAATGLTHGIIHASSQLEQSQVVICPNKDLSSATLCDYGDSGSLWLYDDGTLLPRPVALHLGRDFHDSQRGRAQAFTSLLADIHLHQSIMP